MQTDLKTLPEGRWKGAAAIAAILFVVTVAVYWQTTGFDFVNYDDHLYVLDNPYIRSGLTPGTVAWAFTDATRYTNYWTPLTWMSFLVDYELHGLSPGGYHLTNLLLHALSAAVLFGLLLTMTGALWPSALVAVLFALHPIHVESVAWVTERKDVLSTIFWLIGLWMYAQYARAPGPWWYAGVLLFFLMGLMAKPMLVTFPFVLLLLDFWPLGRAGSLDRWPRLVLEKVPLFILTAAFSAAAFVTQAHGGAIMSLESLPLTLRLENVLVAYFTYIGNVLLPIDLAVIYPHPGDLPLWQPLLAGIGLLAITVAVVRKRNEHPYAIVGWFWYLGTLVPVIGLVVIGPHSVADRYAYIPLMGLYVWFAWSASEIAGRYRLGPRLIPVAIFMLVAGLIPITWHQIGFWKNSTTLFERALAVTHDNDRAHSGLGLARYRDGRIDDAIIHYRESIRINPDYHVVHTNLANALHAVGDVAGARYHFEQALRLYPENPVANTNLAIILLADGDAESAIPHLRMAIEEAPDRASSREVLAQALLDTGRAKEAESHLRHALRYTSAPREIRLMLVRSLLAQNRSKEAIDVLAMQLREDPDDIDALGYLGEALVKTNNAAAAVRVFEHQLKLEQSAQARNNLGIALANAGRREEAVRQFSEAVRLSPDNEVFRDNLEMVMREMGPSEP